MANLSKFFDKAKQIYAAMKASGSRGRSAWNEAQHQASIFFKGLKKGVLAFQTDEGEVLKVSISQVIDEAASSLVLFIKDITSNTSYTVFPYQLV